MGESGMSLPQLLAQILAHTLVVLVLSAEIEVFMRVVRDVVVTSSGAFDRFGSCIMSFLVLLKCGASSRALAGRFDEFGEFLATRAESLGALLQLGFAIGRDGLASLARSSGVAGDQDRLGHSDHSGQEWLDDAHAASLQLFSGILVAAANFQQFLLDLLEVMWELRVVEEGWWLWWVVQALEVEVFRNAGFLLETSSESVLGTIDARSEIG